jgi:hypothetical protein
MTTTNETELEWVTNTHDLEDPHAPRGLILSRDEWAVDGTGTAWQGHLEWLADKVIGEPKATEECTVEELKAEGMVGVYRRVAA